MSQSKHNKADNITDLRQLRRERSRKRAIKRLGIFLGVVCAVSGLAYGVQVFFQENYVQEINSFFSIFRPGDGYPVEVLGSNVVDMQNAGGNLAIVTKNRVVYFNPNGYKVEEFRHNLYNVDAICYRSKTLLYDRGGNDLKVYNGSQPVFEQKYPKTIYCADLSSGGNLAVATRSDSHTSMVTVYNSRFQEIYKWYSADGYIVDICLPASGNNMVAATIDTEAGELISTVHIFDFANENKGSRFDLRGELLVDMYFTGGDNSLYVLTDKKLYELSASAGAILNSYDFSNRTLWSYSFDNGIITLVIGDYVEQRSLDIIRLKPGFSNIQYASCTDHFIDVYSDSKHTYLLTDNSLHVYSANMEEIAVYETPDGGSIEVIGEDVYYTTADTVEKLTHRD